MCIVFFLKKKLSGMGGEHKNQKTVEKKHFRVDFWKREVRNWRIGELES